MLPCSAKELINMNKFQIFRLNFSLNISIICIILITNFQKSPSVRGFRPQLPLIFDFGDLKMRDLTKLCFFKLIMTESNFKKIS